MTQLHRPGEKFYDFNKVRDEIVADTEAKTGKNAGSSRIHLDQYILCCRLLTEARDVHRYLACADRIANLFTACFDVDVD